MDIKRLKYFIAVAEEMNFGRAAERLGIAQPALSRQIALLEAELSTLLFDRSRASIRLTQAGDALLIRAREMIDRMSNIAREVTAIGEGLSGTLKIGFVESALYGVLPQLIKAYAETFDRVELSLETLSHDDLERGLTLREIDIAIARPYLHSADVQSILLHTEPLILALPDDGMSRQAGPIFLNALHARTFILFPARPRPSFADHILHVCSTSGFAPAKMLIVQDCQTAIGLVSAGLGVSLVPQSAAAIQRPGVTYRRYVGSNPGSLLTAHARVDNRSPQARNFMKMTATFSCHFRLSSDLPVPPAIGGSDSYIFSVN